MIIFTPHRNIPVEMLEEKGIRQVVTYNLSSYFSDVPTLNMLIPSIEYLPKEALDGDINDIPIFDITYGKYIIENDLAFIQLMNIIVPVYQSPETLVQILVRETPYSNAISESLSKFIQQRYGYNAYFINELEDFVYTEEQDFSIPGLFALDSDLGRWRLMIPQQGVEDYE